MAPRRACIVFPTRYGWIKCWLTAVSAVSLGAILLWIAQRLGLPVVPVIFPTQMLLRADPETSEEMWLINPFNGETLDEHTTGGMAEGQHRAGGGTV